MPFLAPLTIFLGSFLLFGVQPLVGRTLLPAFGGTSAEWVACLCAFQTLLLLGYFQAHLAASGLRRRRVHIVLLLASAVWAFFAYSGWMDYGRCLVGGSLPPGLQVLICVLALCGLPYALLSANSSLVQACVAEHGDRGVYRLYGVSNAGSLAGLLAYPLLFEPYVDLQIQWRSFSIGIAIYTGLLWRLGRAADRVTTKQSEDGKPELSSCQACSRIQRGQTALLWIALPAFSCFLLDAVTAHLTLDVMPMPLLWTLLLAVFLSSYIAGFTSWAERNVVLLALLTLASLCAVCWIGGKAMQEFPIILTVGVFSVFLAAACTFFHAWLYQMRPETEGLTRYYLCNAAGGAMGGVLASLVAPMVFDRVTEYPISLAISGLLATGWAVWKARWNGVAAVLGLALLGGAVMFHQHGSTRETRPVVYRGRSFFGTIQVLESKARTSAGEGVVREFVHGTTIHGIQAHLPGKTRMPTTYYTPDASGYAIVAHPKYRKGEPMRVNITGLGIGVLFCYGRTNDYYRAYEISENALAVATDTNLFTFVSDCPAKKEIVLGDARQGLEDELRRGVEPYDVIIVDAFTGDNLPYHLSTREAFELYFQLLKPDGVLCVNISNWHLGLEPFMRKIGEDFDVPLLGLETQNDYGRLAFGAKVAFFCREPSGLAMPPVGPKCRIIDFNTFKPMSVLPTDEKGSFLSLVKFR